MDGIKFTKQVKRVPKKFSKFLGRSMVVLAILFVIGGVALSRGLLLPAFLLALLYYFYTFQSDREYDYIMENGHLTIDVIKGKRRRKTAHELDLKDLEVVAPNWHEAVAQYRKEGGSVSLPKYDYTSYDDEIPFYTMIITEDDKKIKLLLDLSDEMLREMKKMFPQRVYLS